jgi:hypothetical protein
MAAESEAGDMRPRAGTLARNLPLLWDTGISKSLCLYLTPNGELHIYFDGKHIKKMESGLPVDVPLWGAVDVSGRCVKIKSQLLKPLEGEAATTTTLHHADDVALPPMDCFKNKAVKVEVPPSEKTVTVAPRGLGIALKVPPEALQQTGAPPTFAFTTCTPESFVYPDGYKSLSPIYYIASNKPLKEELEVLLEHNVNIESSEQAEEMIFCIAQPPEDGSKEVRFIPIPAGKFNVGIEHGSLITNQLGFLNAGTKAADTSKIENRYAVMFTFSNKDCSTRHVGISMSLANEVYMTNFRDSLQEEWKTSVSHRSRVPVVFEGSSACVLLPQNYEGWEIAADTQHCDFPKESIDYDGRDCLAKMDYPPRFTFTIKATGNAKKSCTLPFSIVGLTDEICFQIQLNPTTPTVVNDQG